MPAKFAILMLTISHTLFAQKSFHDFRAEDMSGKEVHLYSYKGKKVLVVYFASECGFTPQYAGLQELYETFGGEDFTILAFPSNEFGAQEPGSNEEIISFCRNNYGVTFQVMAKVKVKGQNQIPLYAWLTKASENGVSDAPVTWNFQKFLIDGDGKWLAYFAPATEPLSDDITKWLKQPGRD